MNTDASNSRTVPLRETIPVYDDEADRKRHMAYIASIAEEKHRDVAEIAPYYEHVLCDLRGQARVHDYLNIFVAKKVFEQLKGH